MKRLTLITLILLFTVFPAFSENNNKKSSVPSFTNKDLEKYGSSSDTMPVQGTGSENNPKSFKNSLSEDESGMRDLRRYVIPYDAYEGTARRIIIPVTFNGRITAPMLLDTGAPGMHISYALAEKLSIFKKNEGKLMVSVSGIGGNIPAVYTIIDEIHIGEAKANFIPTVITRSVSGKFEGLIGMDFLTNYSVEIDTTKHVVIFEELPARSNMPAGHDETWWRLTFSRFSAMKSAWKKYRSSLEDQKGDSQKINELKKFADQQHREAQKLYSRLWVYAGTHAVPNEWR